MHQQLVINMMGCAETTWVKPKTSADEFVGHAAVNVESVGWTSCI
jgi:hypothetical protein